MKNLVRNLAGNGVTMTSVSNSRKKFLGLLGVTALSAIGLVVPVAGAQEVDDIPQSDIVDEIDETVQPRSAQVAGGSIPLETEPTTTLVTGGQFRVYETRLKGDARISHISISTKFFDGSWLAAQSTVVNINGTVIQGTEFQLRPGDPGTIDIDFHNATESFSGDYIRVVLPANRFSSPAQMHVFGQDTGVTVPDYEGGLWSTLATEPNKKMPEKCGLNIGLVFDLSNSVGQIGIDGIRESGRSVIEALEGTPTTIGLFNFGTNAPVAGTKDEPRLDLSKPSDVKLAKETISGYEYGERDNNDKYTDNGGTNWHGALKNVVDSNTSYDVVYFITDGVPTTNIEQTPKNVGNRVFGGTTGDSGRITHNQDISKAVQKANDLKRKGSRLEVLAVGDPNQKVPVLKDYVQDRGAIRWVQQAQRPFWPDRTIAPGTFSVVSGFNPDLTSYFSERVHLGILGTNRPTAASNPLYFRLEDEVTSTPTGSEVDTEIQFADRLAIHSETITAKTYTSNYTSALDIMKSISGSAVSNSSGVADDDADFDVHTVPDYTKLAARLFKLATANCKGALIVQKHIVDTEGNVLEDEKVDGWEFNNTAPTGDLFIEEDASDRRSPDRGAAPRLTDDKGTITYKFGTKVPHKEGMITIGEVQKDGYTLRQQAGKNATCSVVDLAKAHANGESPDPVPLEATNEGEFGFTVPVGTAKLVNCVVHNRKDTNEFAVAKAPLGDQDPDMQGSQLKSRVAADGTFIARYVIEVTNKSSRKATLAAPVVDAVNFPAGTKITSFALKSTWDSGDGTTTEFRDADNSWRVNMAPEYFGEFKTGETKKVYVDITAVLGAESLNQLRSGTYHPDNACESDRPRSPEHPKSLFNAVSLEGEVDGERPEENNQACVDPELPRVNFSVHKVDSGDESVSLDGAEFTIYRGDATADPATWTEVVQMVPKAGDTSTLILPNNGHEVVAGPYLLVETKAPKSADGKQYSLLPQPVAFSVDSVRGQTKVTIADRSYVARVNDNALDVITVANVHVGDLPRTGGLGVLPYLLAAMLLIGTGWFYQRKNA